MYEYEIHYLATGENDFLYGYSITDLIRRYPEIDSSTYVIVNKIYID